MASKVDKLYLLIIYRRDSFITHRAFCDALAQESAKALPEKPTNANEEPMKQAVASLSPPPPPATESQPPSPAAAPKPLITPAIPPSTAVMSFVSSVQNTELRENPNTNSAGTAIKQVLEETAAVASFTGSCSSSSSSCSTSSSVFGSLFASSTASGSLPSQPPGFADIFRAMAPDRAHEMAPPSSTEPVSLCLAMSHGSSIFRPAGQEQRQYTPAPQPAMSATALLQKAAQMGAAATSSSLLRGFGVMSSTSSSNGQQEWSRRPIDATDGASLAAGLGLGLPCDAGSGLKELMLGTPSVFGPKHPTLDLLGLGMAASVGLSPGLSALITSMGSDMDMTTAAGHFGGKDLGRNS
ncbi:hypothetical protein RND71_011814 [Anisodus tanguticus]|uniref:BIRD-IDD transcription factor fourth C2HC zinc finger domain-containing protein n=1 Tax=Anisodus tanguticus TaxID=243964 RepID=A0AAE1SE74_9SOLA|nr:hypothetical protein RND71_011814 [Anisodus tanguticus]